MPPDSAGDQSRQRTEHLLRAIAARGSSFVHDTTAFLISAVRIATDPRIDRTRIPRGAGRGLIVLGAGPSLTATLGVLGGRVPPDVSLMSVNDYYKTEVFRALRPTYHVIADPAYWIEGSYDEFGAPLLAALTGTDWPATLFVPARARGSRFYDGLIGTGRRIVLYRTTPLKGYPGFESFAFWRMLGMPRAQNVLVAALAIALWLRFPEICLVGADHGWHKELELSAQNILMVTQTHSYDIEADRRPFLKPEGVGRYRTTGEVRRCDVFSIREIFTAWAAVHDSYERLARIAERRGVRIWNSSASTFIDAFDRRDFAQFLAAELPR